MSLCVCLDRHASLGSLPTTLTLKAQTENGGMHESVCYRVLNMVNLRQRDHGLCLSVC